VLVFLAVVFVRLEHRRLVVETAHVLAVVARGRDHPTSGDRFPFLRADDEALAVDVLERFDEVGSELTARLLGVIVQQPVQRFDVDPRGEAEVVLEVGTSLNRRAPAVEDHRVQPVPRGKDARRTARRTAANDDDIVVERRRVGRVGTTHR